MLLGSLLQDLDTSQSAEAALMALGNLVQFAEVERIGAVFGETPGRYVANAARRFTATASADDWTQLMSAITGADNPAAAATASREAVCKCFIFAFL